MNVLSVGFPGAWSLLTDDAGWTWSETCVAADSMPVRSIARERRRGRGGRIDGAWALCFSSVCPSGLWLKVGWRDWRGEREREKTNLTFYRETGNKRFLESILTQLSSLSLLLNSCVASQRVAEHRSKWDEFSADLNRMRNTFITLMWLFLTKQDKRPQPSEQLCEAVLRVHTVFTVS